MELVRCTMCEKFEARQIAVGSTWRNLFLAGKLTLPQAEQLEQEEQAIIGNLKDHQALEHDHAKSYEGQIGGN